MSSSSVPLAFFEMLTVFSGRIVIAKGEGSVTLFSKNEAHSELEKIFKEKMVSRIERDIIAQQVDRSPLPKKASSVMSQLQILTQTVEEMRQEIIDQEEMFSVLLNGLLETKAGTLTSHDAQNDDQENGLYSNPPERKILH